MSAADEQLKDLIRRCRKNDRDAQFKLYSRYADAMLNCAYRITGSREDAEDALQEAFISVFRNINKFRKDAAFSGWVKRIVINKSLNILRKKRPEFAFEMDEIPEKGEMTNGTPDPLFNPKKEIVLEALRQLPDGYRTVLSLYLLEGYDHEEISGILNISKATSLTQYHRGKKKLRELVTKLEQKIKDEGQSGKVVQRS